MFMVQSSNLVSGRILRYSKSLRFGIFFITLVISQNTFSQSRLGVMLGGGVDYYSGEMNDRVMTDPNLLRAYGNIGLLYRISRKW